MIERTTLTAEELSMYLGLSKDYIYKLARAGEIPNFKIGSRVFFRVTTIEKWLHDKEQESMSVEVNEEPNFQAIK